MFWVGTPILTTPLRPFEYDLSKKKLDNFYMATLLFSDFIIKIWRSLFLTATGSYAAFHTNANSWCPPPRKDNMTILDHSIRGLVWCLGVLQVRQETNPSLLWYPLPCISRCQWNVWPLWFCCQRGAGEKVDRSLKNELKLVVANILSLPWRLVFTAAVIGTSRGGRVDRGSCITGRLFAFSLLNT